MSLSFLHASSLGIQSALSCPDSLWMVLAFFWPLSGPSHVHALLCDNALTSPHRSATTIPPAGTIGTMDHSPEVLVVGRSHKGASKS